MSVKIQVKTTIFQYNSKEMIESTARGRFFQKDKASYLQYEEAGEEGSTRTVVKVSEAEALILRSGAVKMRLPFMLHKKMRGSYEMSLGRFDTATVAKRIEHTYHAESGEGLIDILYDFSMQGAPRAGTYHLEITFQEEEE